MRSAWNKLDGLFSILSAALFAGSAMAASRSAADSVAIHYLHPDGYQGHWNGVDIQITNYNRFARSFGFSGKPRDPAEHPALQRRRLRKYIRTELKDDLISIVTSPVFKAYAESGDRNLAPLGAIPTADLTQDIRSSRYQLSSECIDSLGVKRDAVAEMSVRGGTICLNPDRILVRARASGARYDAMLISQLVQALLLHEHAHHFDILDSDGSLLRSAHALLRESGQIGRNSDVRVAYVSAAFADLRRSFREATSLNIHEIEGTAYNCSITVRPETDKLIPDLHSLLLPTFGKIRFVRDRFAEDEFQMVPQSPSGASPIPYKRSWIGFDFLIMKTSHQVSFAAGRTARLAVFFRMDHQGRLRLEVATSSREEYLPAVSAEVFQERLASYHLSSLAFGECERSTDSTVTE